MVNNYMEKINLIHDLLISSNVIKEFIEKIPIIEIQKYELDIGSILYSNGKINNDYMLFPYDAYIKKGTNDTIGFKIAITYDPEENSLNYKSQFSSKKLIKIRKGVVLIGCGKYLDNKKSIELNNNDIHFMIWNTNIDLQTLKDQVQWQPYLKPYINNIPNIENKIYRDYNIYLETHHIDNNPENESSGNILKVTMEQHASIHLWMWDQYKLDENFLKNNF
jgi:hypothetical protein